MLFDALPDDERQALVISVGQAPEAPQRAHRDVGERQGLASLEKQGLTPPRAGPQPDRTSCAATRSWAAKARRELAGRLFDGAKLLDEVEKELAAFRARQTAKS